MPQPLVFNIQRFSVHDGPGIRTTVFFCGCPLRCRWCHNPEGQAFPGEGVISGASPASAAGSFWPVPALVGELEKDRIFYDESGGGVTLSGGEPLALDMGYIARLALELKRKGIHIAVDTCGDVPYESFRSALAWADLFLYDLKLLNDDLHISLTGASNRRILANLSLLGRDGAPIILRLPLLSGINDSIEDMESIADRLAAENVKPYFISLLPYHLFARGKYSDLNLAHQEFSTPDAERLKILAEYWTQIGYPAGIGGGIKLGGNYGKI